MLDKVTLKEVASLVCKEWMYMIRSELALSSYLIIKIEKGIQDINMILESHPALRKIQFKIPENDYKDSMEFIKALKFDYCSQLKKVTATGDFSNSFGFRNRDQQEKYEFDIGFPVEVLEITFNPKMKNHLNTGNIKKLRLNFSGTSHLMLGCLMPDIRYQMFDAGHD